MKWWTSAFLCSLAANGRSCCEVEGTVGLLSSLATNGVPSFGVWWTVAFDDGCSSATLTVRFCPIPFKNLAVPAHFFFGSYGEIRQATGNFLFFTGGAAGGVLPGSFCVGGVCVGVVCSAASLSLVGVVCYSGSLCFVGEVCFGSGTGSGTGSGSGNGDDPPWCIGDGGPIYNSCPLK